jgi:HAD superfamily hydrolase (TIGR01662 family)
MTVAVVVPTVGRPSLGTLLQTLATTSGALPEHIVLVDDRTADAPLPVEVPERLRGRVHVRRSGGRGPAAARNVGWRAVSADWIAFLDDDVQVAPSWAADLAGDLAGLSPSVAASQGRITVPLPSERRPTDWERGTAGLADSRWITADIAYRRSALVDVRGFDERFPRAFREDADLALRVQDAGYELVRGLRRTVHPVRPATWDASLRQQHGNADDALMRALHGPDWHRRAAAPVGRRPLHLATTAAALAAAGAVATRRSRIAAAAAAVWAGLTTDFAVRRILPGPRTRAEIARLLATSALIPPAATAHWLRGVAVARRARPWADAAPRPCDAVLFDRDGTLVHDVPYNSDPALVEPVADAAKAVQRLRNAGVRIGVVSNQSGIARGLLTAEQVAAVNARIDELIGPFDTWQYCPHDAHAGCACRKPAPGLVEAAAAALGVRPERCVVIGDIGSDVAAATSAGGRGVLVPNEATRADEVNAAPLVAPTLLDAVDLVLEGAS